MPRQRRGDKADNSRPFPRSEFINIRLSAQEAEHLRQLVDAEKLTVHQAYDLVSSGFKLSLNRDDNNSTFVASLTDKPTAEREYSIILTGRGSSPANALYALLYKHFVVSEGLWGDGHVSSGGASDFS